MKRIHSVAVDIAKCPLVIAVQESGDVYVQAGDNPVEAVIGLIHEIANKMEAESGPFVEDGGPDTGHQFHISVQTQGSLALVGEPHVDNDWVDDPITLTVRAWNLTDALRKAAAAPLPAWDGLMDQEALQAEEAAERAERAEDELAAYVEAANRSYREEQDKR